MRLEAYDKNNNFQGPAVYVPPPESIEWPIVGLKEITADARKDVKMKLEDVEFYFSFQISDSSNFRKVLDKGWNLAEAGRVVAISYRPLAGSDYFTSIVGAAMKKKVKHLN